MYSNTGWLFPFRRTRGDELDDELDGVVDGPGVAEGSGIVVAPGIVGAGDEEGAAMWGGEGEEVLTGVGDESWASIGSRPVVGGTAAASSVML